MNAYYYCDTVKLCNTWIYLSRTFQVEGAWLRMCGWACLYKMALSWTYLAASMAAMLLCCYFGSRDAGLRLCEWLEFSAEVAETAKILGSKTPYPLLQHIQERAHVEVKRNLTGCQAVKVMHHQCYDMHCAFHL